MRILMKKRCKLHKKTQAIGELLMRIGGLILIISLIMLVLIRFEVIKFDDNMYKKYLPKTCLFKTGLECIDDAIINSESVTVILNNEGDVRYNLINFDITVIYPLNSSCINPNIEGNPVTFPVTIESKSTMKFNYSCVGLVKDDYFEAKTKIILEKTLSSSKVEYNGKIIGEIK